MILHLVLDEKVITRMMDSFDELGSDNIYLCVTRKKGFENLKHLQKRENLFLLYGGHLNEIPWKKIRKVCIHFLDLHKLIAFEYLSKFRGLRPDTIIWMTWGGDYYDLAESKGFKVYADNNSRKKNPYNSLVKNIFWSGYGLIERIVKTRFLKNRVNYLIASKVESDLILGLCNFKRLKGTLNMTYYSIEDVLKGLKNSYVQGNDVIIGNSASTFNNHEYIYDFIKDLPFEKENVHLPLNYGGYPDYRNTISNLYGTVSNIHVISNFMDLDSYNGILCGCSTFIYGHFRQAGWGNIIIALYLGGKVYLPKESQNYKNFVEFGFKVFILEDIRTSYHEKLTSEEQNRNRKLALELFSKQKNREQIEYIYNV